jgi:DAACS family dicarboxylate/amino acid:cation (Na+ or H+) symporter
MCRTTLNVAGDITAATYVARSEGYPLIDVVKSKLTSPKLEAMSSTK